MLRQIWHRAAALALPLTLAICLPPLAVIALNLRADSTASPPAGHAPVSHSKLPPKQESDALSARVSESSVGLSETRNQRNESPTSSRN